jgi:CubicO group peptidase (beta-lactamase class C family)
MARLAVFVLQGGELEGNRLMRPETLDAMVQGVSDTNIPASDTGWFSLAPEQFGTGWFVDEVEGHRTFGHGGGSSGGFDARIEFAPDDGLAVIAMSNASALVANQIALDTLNLLLGVEP